MNAIDKRKFPRVNLASNSRPELTELLGVAVIWPSGHQTHVLDLSYSGAAVVTPEAGAPSVGQMIQLKFQFEGDSTAEVNAKVVRHHRQTVGLEFAPLSTSARSAFEQFVCDKLRGLNLRLINPHYYGPKEDFSYWFCGPNETHVFIWLNKKELIKAWVQLDRDVLVYENGEFLEGQVLESRHESSAQISGSVVPGNSVMMKKSLALLSQVQEGHELLESLIALVSERVKSS